MKKREDYNPASIEKKWQKKWTSSKIYEAKDKSDKPKAFILDMFPYPSGEGLHVGHPKGYIATDIVSRMKRMQGYNVLHPMGFDAFGLPAENYAIKTKTNPMVSVAKNVAHFKDQLSIIGLDYDWKREVNTTDPKYYRWTQWIFLQLWKKGLAFESFEPINWCPSCKTGLANEDVEDGRCERCGTVVEKKPLRQWVLKITKYADRLLSDLDTGLEWPEAIKESQRNWIGRSEGASINFEIHAPNKPRVVIIHGYKGSSKTNFIPWLKSTLEKRGLEVVAPELPNSAAPTEAEQVAEVLRLGKFDENTVVIGHSLGAIVAMKAIMKAGVKISGLVLIAAAKDPKTSNNRALPYHKTFDWNFDFEKINKLSCGRIAVLSDTREGDRMEYLKNLSKKLNAALIEAESVAEHFCATEEPEILKSVTPSVDIFTTRPDTIFGVTYIVLAPEHGWVSELKAFATNKAEIESYVSGAAARTDIERKDITKEKTGVELKGITATNPATGEKVPVWISDYVLLDYGTGAVMAVPAHDERDMAFAKKFGLPIKKVVESKNMDGAGVLINSGKFNGRNSEEVQKEITTFAGGAWVTKYKLRDWVFSRQRYWGEPIPLIHCPNCGVVAVPEKDLPIELPKVSSYEPTGTGESPLAAIEKWVNVKCLNCHGKAKRETNTMPQWAGSCWYYLRYEDPKNKKALVDPKLEKYWSPVDLYVGGAEHATRHLIYARFWHKFLFDIGVVSSTEPFKKLQSVGLIMGEDGRKMSKRFGNVVNPDDVVKTYGADSLRVYEMFMGPFDQQISWSTDSMVGSRRFIERVWKMADKVDTTGKTVDSKSSERALHKAIKKVSDDITNLRFNTAISTLMITLNEFETEEKLSKNCFETFLKLLAPFAPHVTEELWAGLGNKKSIHVSSWPVFDETKLEVDEVTIMVQVNGKTRADFKASPKADKETLEKAARDLSAITKWIEGKEIKRVVVVPGKLVNIVC